jgi:hypothetical protein
MHAQPAFTGKPSDKTDLLGIGISAGLLVALGCLWGLYAVLFAILLCVTGVQALALRLVGKSFVRSAALGRLRCDGLRLLTLALQRSFRL